MQIARADLDDTRAVERVQAICAHDARLAPQHVAALVGRKIAV